MKIKLVVKGIVLCLVVIAFCEEGTAQTTAAFNGTTVFNNLQAGLAQMNSDSATVKTNFTFSFPKAFGSVPNVLVSPRSAVDVDDTFAVTVRRVTRTNCTVNVVRTDTPAGWGQHVQVTWLAWE